jgi:prevent-host-death family protein
MRKIDLKDAKARPSEVIDGAIEGQSSIITRDGEPVIVVMPYRDYERSARVPSFGWLLSHSPIETEDDLADHKRKPARALNSDML